MKCLVFAPGIMGTGLRNDEGSVWPPTALEAVFGYKRIQDLLAKDLDPTEPIRSVGPMGVYKTLLDDISVCGYSTGDGNKRFLPFPYDWRQPNAISADKLAKLLDATFPDTIDDLSITFLGHSMGGLVMRYLLESGKYADRPWYSQITRLITMGTPHFGSSLALFRLRGTDKSVGLSGPDIKRLANEPGYSSAFELVPPTKAALTVERPMPGNLPGVMDPFDAQIASRLNMNAQNINLARDFWSVLDLGNRPKDIEYFFIVGSALKTNIRNEWINASQDPLPIERKSAGDGTVPISSACIVGIPHIFSQKKHSTIFTDRQVREYLYRILNAPANVHPQAADHRADVGASDAVGISVNQEVYDPGEEIEVIVSFNQNMTDPFENFELASIDLDTGQRILEQESINISVRLKGVSVSEFGFSITNELEPGLYELRCQRTIDDPEPTTFYIREKPNEE